MTVDGVVAVLIVGVGGFIGAIARYGLNRLVHQWIAGAFPWGTLAVNLAGCLAIGVVMHLVDARTLGPRARLFWGVGLLGAFTTFSAFSLETLDLLREGRLGAATLYVTASVGVGLAAVWLGRAVLRATGV